MSKKSRKNSSKAPTAKVAAAAVARPGKKVAKSVAKAVAKSAVKKTVKKATAKPVKPAAKAPVKASKKPVVKTVKTAPVAKPAKAPAAAKSAVAKAPVKPPVAPKPVKEKTAAPSVAVEGAKAPGFSLPRDGGSTVSLADYAGRKLVIFFYPRANTPGCTKEAIDFTRLTTDFEAANTAILGVSADPLKAQESFRDKHDLTTPLLSDETHSMLKSFGAWGEKSMYGKMFEGVLRTTVLIGSDGRVARIWRSVKVDGHADAVLEEARRI